MTFPEVLALPIISLAGRAKLPLFALPFGQDPLPPGTLWLHWDPLSLCSPRLDLSSSGQHKGAHLCSTAQPQEKRLLVSSPAPSEQSKGWWNLAVPRLRGELFPFHQQSNKERLGNPSIIWLWSPRGLDEKKGSIYAPNQIFNACPYVKLDYSKIGID